tara:strand:- start:50 stop:376 length:327 start_codon:yes stop_codon:yes gene_type:complete
MNIPEINVMQLKEMLDNNNDFILLDVRTDMEVLTSSISSKAIHIPMNEIPNKLHELNKSKEIIVHCKSGKRSKKVCEYLLNNKFINVKNLSGGILDWSNKIDTSIIVL